jgi:hypothetical protein
MSQTYFSTGTLTAGQSVKTTLPTANPDGTGSLAFQLWWYRDSGKLGLSSGTPTIDDNDANLVVTQNGFTLVSVNTSNMHAGPGTGAVVLMPSPSGGAVTFTNNGPGAITGISVCDPIR